MKHLNPNNLVAAKSAPAKPESTSRRRAVILLIVVGMLSMLFITLTAFIQIARFDRETLDLALSQDSTGSLQDIIADSIVDKITESVIAQIGAPTIPGGPGNDWLASPYPIRGLNPNGTFILAVPDNQIQFNDFDESAELFPLLAMHYPEVSTFDGSSSSANSGLGLAPIEVLRNAGRADGPDEEFDDNDIRANARIASADADGDGIPDTSILSNWGLTQKAHESLGLSISAPPQEQRNFETEEDLSEQVAERLERDWDRYNESTQFEVAARIVSNGGHLQLDMGYPSNGSDPDDRPDEFVRGMAGWIFDPTPDETDSSNVTAFTDNRWEELASVSESIERSMRRRGGLRPPAGVLGNDPRPTQLPDAVQYIDQELERIFNSGLYALNLGDTDPGDFEDYSQRFNISDPSQTNENDIQIWNAASYLSPDAFNRGIDVLIDYFGRRNLLGAMNYSDDTAMQLEPDPNAKNYGLYDGQLKFYLGHTEGAFGANGRFINSSPSYRGFQIGRTLVDYFYEMLGGHHGWDGGGIETEAVSRLEQAYMLAVNTLGAAAPYNQPTGSTFDGVIFTPYLRQGTDRTYYGYVPQIYITEAITRTIPEDPNTSMDPASAIESTAMAIEVFNPHDRPLALKQYMFRIKGLGGAEYEVRLAGLEFGANGVTYRTPASITTTLAPRSFATYVINTKSTNFVHPPLEGSVESLLGVVEIELGQASADTITVELVKTAVEDIGINPTLEYVVDEMEIGVAKNDPLDPSTNYLDGITTWMAVRRDTGIANQNPYGMPFVHYDDFGYTTNSPNPFRSGGSPKNGIARWRVVTPVEIDNSDLQYSVSTPVGQDYGFEWGRDSGFLGALNGIGTPTDFSSGSERQPETVLYVPSPQYPVLRPVINGVERPAAFPTVGFLAFIPRFSHYQQGANDVPMGEVLQEQFDVRSGSNADVEVDYEISPDLPYYSSPISVHNVPADFGHMPFFDNQQPVTSTGPMGGNQLPWGTLIFDFFTTHDPNGIYRDLDGDAVPVDPYRIPGQININAASWFMLAGLPVIDPSVSGLFDSSGSSLSPAFWSANSGVLVSDEPSSRNSLNPEYRRSLLGPTGNDDQFTTLPLFNGDSTMRRLGAPLAQAIEAHREQTRTYAEPPSVPNSLFNPYIGASERDPNRNPLQANGPIRQAKGFFTLGELVNVIGFDSSEFNNLNSSGIDGNRHTASGANGIGQIEIDPLLAGDYFRAISLLALLDTHFLTTRSNTYTAYVSIFDRREPADSVRMQMTIDTTNMTRQLLHDFETGSLFENSASNPFNTTTHQFNRDTRLTVSEPADRPQVLLNHRIGYYNTRFDQ